MVCFSEEKITYNLLTEQDNCFIIQHIDNKAEVYSRKARDDLYFGSFFLASLLACTKSFVSLVFRVVDLFTSPRRSKQADYAKYQRRK